MGVLCGFGPYPSTSTASYSRQCALALGFSSGSRTAANTSRTFCGVMLGTYIAITQFTNQYNFYAVNDAISGSYYTIDTTWLGGYSAGSMDTNSSVNLSVGTGVVNMIAPNQVDAKQRRFPIIVEISASSTTNMQVKMFALPQQTLVNGDYTSNQLINAISASVQVTGITCSFTQAGTASFVQKTLTNCTHDKVAYPMDTAFIDFSGGAFEVYDWYIFKVR